MNAPHQSKPFQHRGTVGLLGESRIIAVLGAHRCGTSALTRGLSALGVSLGDNLMKPAKDVNEKGFFEDLDIYRLNERLLRRMGSSWHALAPLDETALLGPQFSDERREALGLLETQLQDATTFAFKDPRTSVLWPFWRCIFDDLGVSDGYAVAVRNPLEAANSLRKRDGFDLAKGVALWTKHMLGAIAASAERPVIFVAFERLLTGPEQQLRRVADALDLPYPPTTDEGLKEYAASFLEHGLRRQRASDAELARSGVALAHAVELYNLLKDATETGLPLASESVERARERHVSLAPLLRAYDAADVRRIEAERQLAASKAAENTPRPPTAAAYADIFEALKNAATEREALEARLKAAQTALADARMVAEGEVIALKDAVRRDRHERDEAENRAASAAADVQAMHARLAEAELQLQAFATENDAATKHLAEARADADRLQREADDLRRKASSLAPLQHNILLTNETLQKVIAENAAQRLDIAAFDAQIREIRASRSYRLATLLIAIPRRVWHIVPGPSLRGRIADLLFRIAPFAFRKTAYYKAWRQDRDRLLSIKSAGRVRQE